MSESVPTDEEKRAYLTGLLTHDPGVFLERHGKLLHDQQRQFFEPLRGDYEVNFYMMMLEDAGKTRQSQQADDMESSQEMPGVSARAKNRRLAKMARLEKQGFFDEEAARKRAPLLHHHYLGQYEPPRAPVREEKQHTLSSVQHLDRLARAVRVLRPSADTLHDQIIEQHEEKQIAENLLRERAEEDRIRAAFDATLSESEDDEDDSSSDEMADSKTSEEDSEDGSPDLEIPVKPGHEPQPAAAVPISAQDLSQNREEFGELMRARFLGGKDGATEADDESSLDDDWNKECQQDMEDKYFES